MPTPPATQCLRYGALAGPHNVVHDSPQPRRGLAPHRAERAKQILLSDLAERVALERVAVELGLSLCHFVRAFRQRFGAPPNRWLVAQRVERAKDMLENSASSLAEIAQSCGFCDQSHFTRAFRRSAGQTPGAWRRRVRGGMAAKH